MNVIVSNKYGDLLNSLDFEISKNINGEYSVDEIISMFSNFFFNKMFLDITAIKDYKDLKNIQKLSISMDVSKIILILDDDIECSSPQFLSSLVSMGIYNFTRNKDGIIYLYNNPNSYRDVAHLHNITTNNDQLNIAHDNNMNNNQINNNNVNMKVILGIKNLTTHAGATTLTHMLKKVLSDYYNVTAIEVNKRDFIFFREENMVSTTSVDLIKTVNSSNSSIILVDLNDADEGICTDVIYLVEPSIIKLNKLLMIERDVFTKYRDKKIILNKSLLDSNDISSFESELGYNIYYNLQPINDRADYTNIIMPLLEKLWIVKKM